MFALIAVLAQAAEPGVVQIQIDSPDPHVQLKRHEGSAVVPLGTGAALVESNSIVCRAPCNKVVDARDGHEFFLSGRGVTDSSRFQLFEYSGPVTIHVDPGTQAYRTLGKVLTYGSIAPILFGGLMFWTAQGMKNDDQLDPETRADWRNAEKTYGFVLLGGAAMLTTGIVLWATSGTTYTIEPTVSSTSSGTRFRVTF